MTFPFANTKISFTAQEANQRVCAAAEGEDRSVQRQPLREESGLLQQNCHLPRPQCADRPGEGAGEGDREEGVLQVCAGRGNESTGVHTGEREDVWKRELV